MSQTLSFLKAIDKTDFKNPHNIPIEIAHTGNVREMIIICEIWNAIPDKILKHVNKLVIKKSSGNNLGVCTKTNTIKLYSKTLRRVDFSLHENLKVIMSVLHHELGHAEFNNLPVAKQLEWYEKTKHTQVSNYIRKFQNRLKRSEKKFSKYSEFKDQYGKPGFLPTMYKKEIVKNKHDIATETYAELMTTKNCGFNIHKVNIHDLKKLIVIYNKFNKEECYSHIVN